MGWSVGSKAESTSCISHVGEPRARQAREQLGYVATPQIMLLNPKGKKVREWIGIVDEPTLAAGLEALARR